MRTIKFRAMSVCAGEGWVYGDLRHTRDGRVQIYERSGCGTDVNPETVGQFTGLHDADGMEIYEGDILWHGSYIYEVKYEEDGFLCDSERLKQQCIDMRDRSHSLCYIAKDSSVIGNVFEKAEYLKGKEEEHE